MLIKINVYMLIKNNNKINLCLIFGPKFKIKIKKIYPNIYKDQNLKSRLKQKQKTKIKIFLNKNKKI